MGAIWFDEGTLADHLHEIVGYKAGVAASIEHLCDLLSGTRHPDLIQSSENHTVRLRSEEYEDLYYALIHKVGLTDRPYNGMLELFSLTDDLKKIGGDKFATAMMKLYGSEISIETKLAISEGRNSLDPTQMMRKAAQKFGKKGLDAIMMIIEAFERHRNLSPHSSGRWEEWNNIEAIENIFARTTESPAHGTFFDQRLINYLSVNHEKLGSIHWRKFEELVAECFTNFGYVVEIGPGSNDDGVDIRAWMPGEDISSPPEYLIQCKRQKEKIDKVTVKGLYADVVHEKSKMGLLVTTSEFSPGARTTVSARGYPVSEVNGKMLKQWLNELRTPGTGIVRV
ncbi:restriction endonuclease [Ectopseudomonas mendocina]